LHFDEGDGAFGEAAVGVKDRVVGIFPSLIGQALFAGAFVFDEAIAIGVAWAIDPGERRLDRRPQRDDGFAIAGALDIKSGEQNE